jgi:hypothetical protein
VCGLKAQKVDQGQGMTQFLLPAKVAGYLKRLQLLYKHEGSAFGPLLAGARYYVRPETARDSWDNTGHDIVLFFDVMQLGSVSLTRQGELCERLKDDINNSSTGIRDEFISLVAIEPVDEADPEYQASKSIFEAPSVRPEDLSFWRPGRLRLFVSHRDSHKANARELADELSVYGISAFAAHDTIEPMASWRNEIQKGLNTMEVLLAYITEDFDDSAWTHQEIGYALGRGVPIISLQLSQKPPTGFLEAVQSLRGDMRQNRRLAPEIYRVIAEKLGNRARLQGALITAFIESTNYIDTMETFDRLEQVVTNLEAGDERRIVQGFNTNDQLNTCAGIRNRGDRFISFMTAVTGKRWQTIDRKLSVIMPTTNQTDDDIPF